MPDAPCVKILAGLPARLSRGRDCTRARGAKARSSLLRHVVSCVLPVIDFRVYPRKPAQIRGALLCDGPTLFLFWKQLIANIARGGCEPNAVRLAPDGAIDLSPIPDFEQTDRFARNKDRIAHSAA